MVRGGAEGSAENPDAEPRTRSVTRDERKDMLGLVIAWNQGISACQEENKKTKKQNK